MPTEEIKIAFRLGVSGSMELDPCDTPALIEQLLDVMREVRNAVACSARDIALDGIVCMTRDCAEKETRKPSSEISAAKRCAEAALLRVISPLAEGADRAFAAAALKLKDEEDDPRCAIRLEVPMPFVQTDYEKTFSSKHSEDQPSSINRFHEFLARAEGRTFEMDGAVAPRDVRHDGYAAVGRTVVWNSDLLIAIWDPDGQNNGPGGTRDTVRFALRTGLPVLLVHPSGKKQPMWVKHWREIKAGKIQDSMMTMHTFVRQELLPPIAEEPEEGRVVRFLQRLLKVETDPLRAYLQEDDQLNRHFWRTHEANMKSLKYYSAKLCRYEMWERSKRDWRWLWKFWVRQELTTSPSSFAAQLSEKYQQRYRTSYLFMVLSGAFALSIACDALARHLSTWEIAAELAFLLIISSLWLANKIFRWHPRYVSYRLLAELLRAVECLRMTGRNPPGARLDQASEGRQRWVAWLYAAKVRAGEINPGVIDVARKEAIKTTLLKSLIDGQLNYHERRLKENRGAERVVGGVAAYFFLMTVIVVAVKLAIHLELLPITGEIEEKVSKVLAYLAVGLPILAAALFSMRTYEEFGILADQSGLMIEELDAIRKRVIEIDPEAPLSLQELGVETLGVARLIVEDVKGWAQVFKLKAVEG